MTNTSGVPLTGVYEAGMDEAWYGAWYCTQGGWELRSLRHRGETGDEGFNGFSSDKLMVNYGHG